MANEYFNSSYTLKEVGETNRNIDKYIITQSKNVVKNNDNSGNVIIYETNANDQGVMNSDFIKDKYTSLYIGDEHIASGFGFTNLNEKNNLIKNVDELKNNNIEINDKLLILETELNNIKNKDNGGNDNLPINNSISIDKSKNYIYVDEYKYVLNNLDNTLSIDKTADFIIHNIKIYYDITEIKDNVETIISANNCMSMDSDDLYIKTNYNFKINKFVVSFENSNPITNWKLSYFVTDGNNLNFSNQTGESIYNIYEYNVESKYGNLYNGQYSIDFSKVTEDNGLENKLSTDVDSNIQLVFTIYDESNNFNKIYLPSIHVVSPIYYGYFDNDQDYKITNGNMLIDFHDLTKTELNFIQSDNTNSRFLSISIPNYLFNNNSKTLKMIFSKQVDIEVKWNKTGTDGNQNTINGIYYTTYVAPYRYIGNTKWILSIV